MALPGQVGRHARPRAGHPRPSDRHSKTWMATASGTDAAFSRLCPAMSASDQILLGDDFTEPCIVSDELLDEFMHAVLEDIVHMAVFKPVADAAGVALGGALAAIGDPDLIEIAHQVAVAACQRTRQRVVEDQKVSDQPGF